MTNVMFPEISVVIPLYNKQDYIKDCINSLLDQKDVSLEIIVIDDGSTDNSIDIVESLITQGEVEITLFRQRNSGPSSARNKGIELSKGKYIMFVDADDFMVSNSLSYLLKIMKKYNPDFLEFDFSENEFRGLNNSTLTFFDNKNDIITNLLNNQDIKSVVCGALYKTSTAKECAFIENMKWGEDSCYKLDYILKSNFVIYLSESLYVNRILFNNTLSRQPLSKEMLNSVIDYINYYELKLRNNKDLLAPLYRRLFRVSVSYLKAVYFDDSVDKYKKEIEKLRDISENSLSYVSFSEIKYLVAYYLLKIDSIIFKNKLNRLRKCFFR